MLVLHIGFDHVGEVQRRPLGNNRACDSVTVLDHGFLEADFWPAQVGVVKFRVARYSGVANCQRELRFLRSFGRRSAHFRMESSVGQRDWPHAVRQYSTFGGT